MADNETYLVEVFSPGIVLSIPGSKETLRTPLRKIVKKEHLHQWKVMLMVRGAADYKITPTSTETSESTTDSTTDETPEEAPKKRKKKLRTLGESTDISLSTTVQSKG